MTKYCECGRRIVIFIGGTWVVPGPDGHDLCQQCWQSQRDSLRIRPRFQCR